MKDEPYDVDFVVADGDWGGQIYFSVPKSMMHKDADVIGLVVFVDRKEWGCNESEGWNVCDRNPLKNYESEKADYESDEEFEEVWGKPSDTDWNCVGGGMGGGLLLKDDVWVHPDIPKELKKVIKSHLLNGKPF